MNVVELAQELVRLPSVNPMDRPADSAVCGEHRVTDFLQQQFERLGLPWQRQEVHGRSGPPARTCGSNKPSTGANAEPAAQSAAGPVGPTGPTRDNILARLEGTNPNRPLLLEVHQDTVPIDGMTVDPFAAEIQDGRLYGRGTCDVKGSMAVMLAVLEELTRLPVDQRPTVVMACTVNEEHGFTGATALTELIAGGESPILPVKPAAILVAEPTRLDVVVAHKGVVRWRCRTTGTAAHSSDPGAGVNAIYRMAEVVSRLDAYAAEVKGLGSHPLLGSPTLSVGTIRGGISVNTVPDECVIEIDRRMLPDESPQTARQRVIGYLAENATAAGDLTHDKPFIIAGGMSEVGNDQLAEAIIQAVATQDIHARRIGVPFGTDASALVQLGVPVVVFGPGDIAQAHRADEWIEIRQLELAQRILSQFCRQFVARTSGP